MLHDYIGHSIECLHSISLNFPDGLKKEGVDEVNERKMLQKIYV